MATKLEQCIGTTVAWLRSLAGGTFLCTAECDGPGPCCENDGAAYPGSTGLHSCGRPDGATAFCVTELRRRIVQTTGRSGSYAYQISGQFSPELWAFLASERPDVFAGLAASCSVSSTGEINLSISGEWRTNSATINESNLNGENWGLGQCGAVWQVPVLDSYLYQWSEAGTYSSVGTSGPCGQNGSYDRGGGTGNVDENCETARNACWPIGHRIVTGSENVPAGSLPSGGTTIPLGHSDVTTTAVDDRTISGQSGTKRTVADASLEWTGTDTTQTHRYRASRTVTENGSGTISGTFGGSGLIPAVTITGGYQYSQRDEYSEEVDLTTRMGWSVNCDGTQGPSSCPATPANCDPRRVRFIVGAPCGGTGPTPRPFVLPVQNVLTCGYVLKDGICYRFTPDGPKIADPVTLGALVGDELVTTYAPQTCCDCLPSCPKTTLTIRPAWAGGYRSTLDGQWRPQAPFVAGRCCCRPGDRLRLVRQISRRVVTFNGEPFSTETLSIDVPIPPEINPGTGQSYPDFTTGFRRDAGTIYYGLRFSENGQPAINFGRYAVDGPVACEWFGFGSQGGVITYGFGHPLDADGMHPRINGLPYPDDADVVDGRARGWTIMRRGLSATCAGLTDSAEWVQVNGGLVTTITADCEWVIVPDQLATDGCSGACPPAGTLPPVLGTNGPGTLTPRTGDLRDLLGGL